MYSSNDILIFQVTNTESVESGCNAYSIFDKNGGSIGADENNHWVIQDNLNTLPKDIARIEWRDRQYCILISENATVFINNSLITPKSGFIRLGNGDLLRLGKIDIKTYIGDETEINLISLSSKPEDIVSNRNEYLDELFENKNFYKNKHKEIHHSINDKISSDPLKALLDDNSLVIENDNLSQSEYISDIATPTLIKSETMKENTHFMDLPNSSDSNKFEYVENSYITISPLLREIGMQTSLRNSQDINDVLTEIGKTLKATIDGLLILQKQQNNLSDKHLRPIEDNPLRLNLNYSDTIDILFGNQKSPVHLSAPAAVSESLHNLLLHNDSNRIAISNALTAILHAFSPIVLLERFENYRRSNELVDSSSSWAWEMYKNYYQELTSTRQKGFEKLFWEVYEQAYDKALRESNIKQD